MQPLVVQVALVVICTVIGAALLLGLGDSSTAPLEAFVAVFGSAGSAALPALVDEMLLFSAQHIPDMVSPAQGPTTHICTAQHSAAQRRTPQHRTAPCMVTPQAAQSSLQYASAELRCICQLMLAALQARQVIAVSPSTRVSVGLLWLQVPLALTVGSSQWDWAPQHGGYPARRPDT